MYLSVATKGMGIDATILTSGLELMVSTVRNVLLLSISSWLWCYVNESLQDILIRACKIYYEHIFFVGY